MGRCEKHNREIEVRAVNIGGEVREFKFCPDCDREREDAERREQESRKNAELQERINKNLDNAMIAPRFATKTLEGYAVANEGQSKALTAIYAFLKNHANSPGMIFTGKPGTGKNHLAAALVREMVVKHNKAALMTTALKITRAIKSTWRDRGDETEMIKRFVEPYLLVIDEIGVQFGSDTERLYLTEIINDRYEWMRPTIILSNLTIGELRESLGERIVDRFRDGGQVIVFDWESYRGRTHEQPA